MIKSKKSLGQNFLIDTNICKKIIKETSIKNKIVLEIGPGFGQLTDLILKNKPKKLYLIEKDTQLSKLITEKYKDNKLVTILNKDALDINYFEFHKFTLISNLPYNLSVKIILLLFNYHSNITEMILMVQKEVSLKFDYNFIGMNKYKFLTKLLFKYKRCFNVPNTVFKPKPKVVSTIVKFSKRNKLVDLKKANNFSVLIFNNKRKKINNKIKIEKLYKNKIMDKRVDQLSINELLYIYDFF